ncbi:uncharacterized protein LOC143554846 [Bidens hawaiensis]|uniref:uncharacterized protein LOC143554846 n=1 Tax=Bidens hawaiensis TaxID=980011 RepID=UPI00404AB5A3
MTESAMELVGYLMDGMIRNRNEKKKDEEADCKRKAVVCFDCAEKGHFSNEYPKRKLMTTAAGASGNGAETDAKKGNARVFMLDTQKAAYIPDVITVKLSKYYEVETDNGSISRITEALNNTTISLADHIILVRLLPMTLAGSDIVLGMGWLSSNQARILCDDKAIDIRTSNNKTILITGDKEAGKVGIISKTKASSCLGKGCLTFIAYVTKEPEPKNIEEVPIVSEFQDVIPDELPGAPTDREVEFRIDLVPGTSLIAKSPYRLAPTEMKELKK